MRERPILFSAPMVRALLSGAKTQTRRVVKRPANIDSLEASPNYPGEWVPWVDGDPVESIFCPYGVPGDRLWVREAWQVARETLDYETGGEYDVFAWDAELYGDPQPYLNGDARHGTKAGLFYAADGEDENPTVFYNLIGLRGEVLREREICWRPSIHMPRWASRITLEITGVRVERLNDISEADALAEGLFTWEALEHDGAPDGGWSRERRFDWREPLDEHQGQYRAAHAYQNLWEHINGPGSWAANPWVFVVEFKRATPTP